MAPPKTNCHRTAATVKLETLNLEDDVPACQSCRKKKATAASSSACGSMSTVFTMSGVSNQDSAHWLVPSSNCRGGLKI